MDRNDITRANSLREMHVDLSTLPILRVMLKIEDIMYLMRTKFVD